MSWTGQTGDENSLSLKDLLLSTIFLFSSAVVRKCGSLYTEQGQTHARYIVITQPAALCGVFYAIWSGGGVVWGGGWGHVGTWCDYPTALRDDTLTAFKQNRWSGWLSLDAHLTSHRFFFSFCGRLLFLQPCRCCCKCKEILKCVEWDRLHQKISHYMSPYSF